MDNKQLPKALARFIDRYGIKKTVIAREIDVTRSELYAYLTPSKFPTINLNDEKRSRLDAWVRRNVFRRKAA